MNTEIITGPQYWPPKGLVDPSARCDCQCGEQIKDGDEVLWVGSRSGCFVVPWHAECKRAYDRQVERLV